MNKTALRKTGLKVIGDIPWGGHICQFYETKQDLLDIAVPFFKAGLENNEYCIWSLNENMSPSEALAAMRNGMPDFDSYYHAGCMEIVLQREWFYHDGRFDIRRSMNKTFARLRDARQRNFEGLRLNDNCGWTNRRTWDNFITFEKALNRILDDQRVVIACTYDVNKCAGADVLDVAALHDSVIARRHGKWEVLEIPSVVTAKEKIKAEKTALEIRVAERTEALNEITQELNRLKDTLKSSEERLHLTVQTAEMSAWDLNLETNTMLTKLGISVPGFPDGDEEIRLDEYMKRILPDDRDMVTTAITGAAQSGKLNMKFRVLGEDGSIHWLQCKGSRKKYHGQMHLIGTTKDITDDIELEYRKADMVTTISHELKTPVTSIKGLSQILEKRLLNSSDEFSYGMLKKMSGQLNRLTGLINDLMETSRLQFGQLPLHITDFSLDELVKEVVIDILKKGSSHRLEIEGTTLLKCHGDRVRVRQVLEHLLGNAIKFSPDEDLVKISLSSNDKEISCCVTDYGIGIARAKQKHIFEKFYRVTDERNYAFQGIGLGLHIASEIIKRLKGRMWLTSKKGEGSTFCFALPGSP